MNVRDITKQILKMHEEEEMRNLMEEVRQEIKNGIPEKLQSELDGLIEKTSAHKKTNADKFIAFIREIVSSVSKPAAVPKHKHILADSVSVMSSSKTVLASSMPETITSLFKQLAVTELLAAAGPSLGDWFSQPMNFGGAGFMLDVRRVIGTDDEVDLYLIPTHPDTGNMKKTLEAYIGQSIRIVISNNDVPLLFAKLYVDETGNAAEGNGHLIETSDAQNIKGKISINIVIND